MNRKTISILIVILLNFCVVFVPFHALALPLQTENVVPSDYSLITQSDTTALYAKQSGAVGVLNKINLKFWDSAIGSDILNPKDMSSLWADSVKSLFLLTYTQPNATGRQIFKTVTSADSMNKVTMSKIQNGVKFSFTMSAQMIKLDLLITLKDNTITVQIPESSVSEYGVFGIYSIVMLPFFGYTAAEAGSYAFVPDGCGGIVDFGNPDHFADKDSMFTWSVYSVHDFQLDDYNNRLLAKQRVMIPVFGIKQGESAFTGIISEGDADANINLYPSGNRIDFFRVATEFWYRYTYSLTGSSFTTNDSANEVVRVSKDRIEGNRAVTYCFTNGSEADYNGMAKQYRNYLISHDLLNLHGLDDNSKLPMELDLFMGVSEKRFLFSQFLSMTTFRQARNIIEGLSKNGVSSLDVTLLGWFSKGYGANPSNYSPSFWLGGKKGLRELSDYIASSSNTLYLQADFTSLSQRKLSSSEVKKFAARGEDRLIITDSKKNNFVMNPQAALQNLGRSIAKIDRYQLSGYQLFFENTGELIYSDFNKKKVSLRRDTVDTWTKMFSEAESFGGGLSAGGNSYALKFADRLKDIPTQTSGLSIIDYDIPFYQLVVHGYIGYTSVPANLFNDFDLEKLKWIEYGCLPYFRLTYKESSKMKYTVGNTLYSSRYEDWLGVASNVYGELSNNLGDVYRAQMINHQKIADGVYRTKYSNGVYVYVNYNTVEYNLPNGKTVKDRDYLVTPVDR